MGQEERVRVPTPLCSRMNPASEWYVGIDYSGAQTPMSSLKGLRVYEADRLTAPREVEPPPSRKIFSSSRRRIV